MSLAQIQQTDFAVGTLLGLAEDVQPGIGVAQALNALVNDDGDLYLRGATGRTSANAVGAPLTWVWSGKVGDQTYILAATDTVMFYVDDTFTLTLIGGASGLFAGAKGVVIGAYLYLPNGFRLTGAAGVVTATHWASPPAGVLPSTEYHLATITGRLIVAAGDTIAFSSATDPAVFAATDYHRLPGGVSVRALYAVQDTLEVFTNYGFWTVANMSYDLTDADGNVQQTLAQVIPDLSLLGEGGITPYKGRVVACCTDGVYLVDPINPPTKISDSIAPLYSRMVELLFYPGGAKVYEDTLFLPMITPEVAIGGMQWRMFTCRLNRPTKARYLYYPWTELAGHASQQSMLDFRDSVGLPSLVTAGADGYLNDLSNVLRQASGGIDADGATVTLTIESRDFPTGQGQPNHLKRVRLWYSATIYGDGTNFGEADVDLSYSVDAAHLTWTVLPPQPVVTPGDPALSLLGYSNDEPLAWWLSPVARTRYARVRVQVSDPDVASFILHRIELQARTASHAR